MAALVKAVQGEDVPENLRLELIARLTGPRGAKKFDVITQTTTVQVCATSAKKMPSCLLVVLPLILDGRAGVC